MNSCLLLPGALPLSYKRFFIFLKSGSHLLSHTVSSIVPSAAYVLTIVFGMGTGVSHKRIATGNFCIKFLCQFHERIIILLDLLSIHKIFDQYRQTTNFLFLSLTFFNNSTVKQPLLLFLRKEVIQPHLPIRLPCYDFTPVIGSTFGSSLPYH